MFQKPIAEQAVTPKSFIPAPNEYDVNKVRVFVFCYLEF